MRLIMNNVERIAEDDVQIRKLMAAGFEPLGEAACEEKAALKPELEKMKVEELKALAKEKIFVPTNWSNVIRDCAPDSYEYQWAADILPLPCDQRYGKEEMQRIADVIHALEP